MSGGRRPDAHRFTGEPHMARIAVGIGVDCDTFYAHSIEGANNAAGDCTAISDKNFLEHESYAPSDQISTSMGVGL